MKIFNAFVAIVLAANLAAAQSPILRQDMAAEATQEAIQGQFLFDAFWVAGFGWDYKISPGTLTIKARPEFFNPKWASVTDPADWKIERRWTIKAIKADGTSETTTIKQWDDDLVYNWPAGSVVLWFGYQIYPHHITGEFSTNPNAGCGLGISLQGFGGGHQIVNPYTINYR
jgi:hypothetical protein